ncbi:hypothetical protein [Acidimangrovimonas pyrenivorans]|uniref:Secreted protein n=1 Tax=Acidimangrovimonas pyrenivorans TaxID=2030798 RepID=A0ABV7AN23_9RHOB
MMKKIVVASLGLALLCASPLAAQTAKRMTHDQLMQWAKAGGYCGSMAVVDAQYLADGRVQVTCPTGYKAGSGTAAGTGLTGGLGASGGAIAGVIGVVVVAAAAGSGSGSSSTTTN